MISMFSNSLVKTSLAFQFICKRLNIFQFSFTEITCYLVSQLLKIIKQYLSFILLILFIQTISLSH